jgi:hypothetical protein
MELLEVCILGLDSVLTSSETTIIKKEC